ncbi:DUF1425 domain-containing protein [Desulfobaculum sp.]|jgi:uncharacterized protein YcfL
MRFYQVLLIGMLLSAVALGGCVQRTSNKGQALTTDVQTKHVIYAEGRAKLVVGDKALLDNLALTNVHFGKVGNFTRATVTLQNLADTYYHIEWNVQWLDREGFPVESYSVWQQEDMTPNMLQPVKFVGKHPDAWGFVINVRML